MAELDVTGLSQWAAAFWLHLGAKAPAGRDGTRHDPAGHVSTRPDVTRRDKTRRDLTGLSQRDAGFGLHLGAKAPPDRTRRGMCVTGLGMA